VIAAIIICTRIMQNIPKIVLPFTEPSAPPRSHAAGRNIANAGRILTTWFTRRSKIVRVIGCAEWRKFRRLYYETTEAK